MEKNSKKLLEKYKNSALDTVNRQEYNKLYIKKLNIELVSIRFGIMEQILDRKKKYAFFNNKNLMSRKDMIKILKIKYTKPHWKIKRGKICEYGQQIVIYWSESGKFKNRCSLKKFF